MKQPARYYLFPRDAYFAPSLGRLVELLEVMDREMALGFESVGSFQGFVRGWGREEDAGADEPAEPTLPTLEATSFDDFRALSGDVSGEPKEIQVQLGRPGREPLMRHDLTTKGIDVLGFASLRMVDVGAVNPAHLLCPSCGDRSRLEASTRPDPRFYCERCGGLTPLPDTRFAIGESDFPFPCYRFVILFDAEGIEGGDPAVSASHPQVAGMEAFEAALGCGLRAVLVRSPGPANP